MKVLIVSIFSLLIAFTVGAAYPVGEDGNESNSGNNGNTSSGSSAGFTPKSNCPPSNARLIMEFNDVRCLIEVGGSLWQNRQINAPFYEVPKGGGNHVIYSGAIWMGGLDVNGQLKLAAIKFRQGNDFWAGPLSQSVGSGNYDPRFPVGDDAIRDFGAATIDARECIEYDQFFTMRKSEVIAFAQRFECEQNPECDDDFPITNDALQRIENWPAHGDTDLGQDFYLAPFYDYPDESGVGDGVYNPDDGDHPWYDDILGRDDIECQVDRRIALFGDITHWWVFNDRGNIHTETGADPIGMEIRAQAFSFATNDEVNRMTFYNYEMINRSTQTLANTYFTNYVDPDIGFAFDDYVGCDVGRGLGYCYNATNFDPGGSGAPGYGENPPAVGVDFFEGPYQDADGIDNVGPRLEEQPDGSFELVTPSVQEAIAGKGIVYQGIGLGYSDGVIDNERYGMRRFNYYLNGAPTLPDTDPVTPIHYYNYMTGRWKDNSEIFFGGTGYTGTTGSTNQPSDYMYPNNSDPLWWATGGVDMGWNWTETNVDGGGAANPEDEDKRFLQHAGPFTLTPGQVNNLTVGVVYGRAFEGDPYASVLAVKRHDTKAQALFDNCFQILDPPNAPVLDIVELENELVLLLDNPFGNNVNEEYAEEDNINIVQPLDGDPLDNVYRFEGYQIFQMRSVEDGVGDIGDIDKARLVAQCDIKNDIARLINFEFDENLGFSVPVEKVDGENRGIRHSFRIQEDAFASGESRLVNHKTYYYIAIAYAHNEFKPYDPDDADLIDGQKLPYLASRLGADGTAISPVVGVPHTPAPRNDGTIARLPYGSSPEITAIDGIGNGNRVIDITPATEEDIINNSVASELTYLPSFSPINVKVIDPLSLVPGHFELEFTNYDDSMDSALWVINRYAQKGDDIPLESIAAERSISSDNEQLIPEWGISVQLSQERHACANPESTNCIFQQRFAEPIEATLDFVDTSKIWLTGVPHDNGFSPQNWIMSGDYEAGDEENPDAGLNNPGCYEDLSDRDVDEKYERLLNGIVTSGQFARFNGCGYNPVIVPDNLSQTMYNGLANGFLSAVLHPGVDIVFTSDKSKWTRTPVIELGYDSDLNVNQAIPGWLRKSPSIDKEGRQAGDAGYVASEGDLVSSEGMGWFPGYAIDVETGRRLNMAYCENSFLANENGADMIWNPTTRFFNNTGAPLLGGQHTIYVFGGEFDGMPAYDNGQFLYDNLSTEDLSSFRAVYRNLSWVMQPMLAPEQELLATQARVRIRINKEYDEYEITGDNDGGPKYEWSMDNFSTITSDQETAENALDIINVVPNPYYAFSLYERDRRDTRVKITNLPDRCKVRIFDTSGKLVRAFDKDSPITSIDWNLQNEEMIPIASGIYIIHVDVPGVGEKVVKFFAAMRQPDLENL